MDGQYAAQILGDRLEDAGHSRVPEIYVVLGSGLANLAGQVEQPLEVLFAEIPGFAPAGVVGHEGRFVAGRLSGVPVLVQSGRYHAYEGHPMKMVVLPVRTAAALGIQVAVFTNAAGGIQRHLEPGSLMLLDDHLNLMWRSPLAGPVVEGESRFPDLSRPYDTELQGMANRAALEAGIALHHGTYAAVLGPSYETPAEIRMLAACGADAVGMSTVPEVIAARASGMRVLGVSMITNRAAGTGKDVALDHAEVLDVGKRAGSSLAVLLTRFLREWERREGAASGD